MGSIIVKVTNDPEDDRYLVWSTVVDNFTDLGPRSEIRAGLVKEWGTLKADAIDRMFGQADRRGSSSWFAWEWNEEREVICNVHDGEPGEGEHYALPRENLGTFYDRFTEWYRANDDGGEAPEPSYLDLLTIERHED